VLYLARHAESTLKHLASLFGAVLVTGARQVGKTTLLEHLVPELPQLTFDNAANIRTAAESPELFFDYNSPPLFLDEIQKAPQLFSEMKQVIDRLKKPGLFYLSGSEQFQLMEQASESLAGRIGILTLSGLSLREQQGQTFTTPFLPSTEYFAARKAEQPNPPSVSATELWRYIHQGSMPALVLNQKHSWNHYYGSYVRTYIERDVRRLTQVADELKFQTFMMALAARTGQMLNLREVASVVGISQPTAQRWLSILRTSQVIYLLRPWHTNLTKRAIKTPKLYFTDTGLAAWFGRWNNPEILRAGAMAGSFFEAFVIMEIAKSYYNQGEEPPLYYYRDKDKQEIDLLLEQNGALHPLEIQVNAAPSISSIKAFRVLDKLPHHARGSGGVICLHDKLLPLGSRDCIIPVTFL
jgi:predicted AAA+ superfamily ATPase